MRNISTALLPFVALLTFALISCQPKEKYIWNTGMSAPKNYIAGGPYVSFYAKGRSVSGASANVGINPGWGFTSGGYTGGEKYKPLPDSASIRWRCGTDLVEYRADFSLPSAKVKEFFNKDIRNADGSPDYYRTLVAGMAPGGSITIWAKGGEQSIEIMKTKAKKISETDRYDPSTITLWSSKGQEASDILTYLYVHGVPYDVWEKGEPSYHYNILFSNKDQNSFSTNITLLSMDGSYVSMNQDEIIVPYKKSELLNINYQTIEDKLPVQAHVQWISPDYEQWFEGEVVFPQDFPSTFKAFEKINAKVYIVFMMDKIDPHKKFTFGSLWLQGATSRRMIMKFRLSKVNIETRKLEVPIYSLPKNYLFPKWQGRIPLEKPKEFEYWQEK